MQVDIKVNGRQVGGDIEERSLLSDFLRETAGCKGVHRGCDTAQCGACTVHLDGIAVKSCNVLALQAEGREVTTIEGVCQRDGVLHPVQQAFRECHGLQCGYCTPGMVMSVIDLLRRNPKPDDEAIRHGLEGNLCRCTGYENIVKSVRLAAERQQA
jgi:aerobic carbon-monoxide dehydrogenase small subunit